ncbi:MAG: hypothetical protein ACKVOB_02850 [Sphingomonas sp.]
MDTVRGFEDEGNFGADQHDDADLHVDDNADFDIGTDERRMHVRAYNHWVSLLKGRAYPSIEDLNPENIADFGQHSVLLDFTAGIEDPAIQFLGRALREECDLSVDITRINQVPSRSLLSRLTDHYLQIIANRAPIGFEAEFVNARGHNTMYRGILMPFSSDDDTIDFIYGVINWKELVDSETQARLDAEVAAAVASMPRHTESAPVWADGPSASAEQPWSPDMVDSANVDLCGDDREPSAPPPVSHTANDVATSDDDAGAADMPLADRLMMAQQTAAAARAADTRSRAALYRALARAHDFAIAATMDAGAYAAMLDRADIAVQTRAPFTPVVKLIFGAEYDKTRLTEFAAVLSFADRHGVPMGGLGAFLDAADGGIKGIVVAERAHRRPAPKVARASKSAAILAARASLGSIVLDSPANAGDFIVLVARASADGMFDIVGTIGASDPLTARAMVKAAA